MTPDTPADGALAEAIAELLPCPFCGCTTITLATGPRAVVPYYQCDWCYAEGPAEAPEDDPPQGWNRRAHPAPHDPDAAEVIASLRQVIADQEAQAVDWPQGAEILAKEMQAIVAADRWKGRDLSAVPPEKWSHLRPETQQFWIDTARRILTLIAAAQEGRE